VNRRIPRLAAAAGTATAVLLLIAAPSPAQPSSTSDNELLLPEDLARAVSMVAPSLLSADGAVTVSIELADPSLAEAVAAEPGLSADAQRGHVDGLAADQEALIDRIAPLGAAALATTQVASNVVVVEVDAAQLPALAAQPEVARILPVNDYQVDLSETVPHIGAAELQAAGLTGAGVDVAVMDTGIDYTHARFGGAGTQAAYEAAYGTSIDDPATTSRDGLFPTDKVVEGFDFVGEHWVPGGELVPDEDPIDCGPGGTPPPCTGGHGTHVASIIAGDNGVAPDANLYAYKVCSSTSTSCSGVAMLQAFEASLDPNGDGDIADAVDVINVSIGQAYGQIEDSSSGAARNAVQAGVTVVISAGNSGDRPYITGSPSSTPEVISVAQTHVPSAVHFVLGVDEPADIADIYRNTNTVAWAPITDGFAGELTYGATPAHRLGCFVDENGNPSAINTGVSPYPAGFFDGRVALVDRGTCSISFKVHNAAEAGAIGVIVANNIAGEAPSFSFGGPDPFTPAQTLIVGQEVGATLKTGLGSGAVQVRVDPDDATPLVNSLVTTSSRGPSNSEVAIKPDIGAPGASLSAEAGTGTGETAFGGTSGAAPMVAGSAALLLEAYPDRTPLEIKSVLMNTAETEVFINPGTRPGELAEITRIGGGEVRVNDAFAATTAAWSAEDSSAGLSFGYHAVDDFMVLRKEITIRNYSNRLRVYDLEATFRHADDAASGAVKLTVLPRVVVRPNRSATVPVILRIDPRKLPEWVLNGGPDGANGPLLKANEFDGYLTVTGGGDEIHLPWHVLPHRASDVDAPDSVRLRNGSGRATVVNSATSGQAATGEVFALTATSPQLPPDQIPGVGTDQAVTDLRSVGVRTLDRDHPQCGLPEAIPGDCLQFGINTYEQRAHPNAPVEFDVLIDANRDGNPDFLVFNRELSLSFGDGRNVVFINQIGTPTATPLFFTDANLNSANAILTVPQSSVGLAEGSQFDFRVEGVDFYFTGEVTDSIDTMTFTVGQPRFASAETVEVPALGSARLAITAVDGGAAASPSQSGVLVLWRDEQPGQEASIITVR
jgi:subtilisin family serine protease